MNGPRQEQARPGPQVPAIAIIDAWSPVVPSREIIDHVADNFPADQLPYLEVFTKSTVDADAFRSYARGLARDDAEILDDLDRAGVGVVLVSGFDERSTAGSMFVSNDSVHALAERHPTRFIPFCGVDVCAPGAATAVRRWITESGFRGVSLRPFMVGLPADDRVYWPVYSACEELGVPVSIHTSANWTRTRSSRLGHPAALDDVCAAFPSLTVIMSHGGYPWVLEACLLAWKHPNLYIELGAHRPKYFSRSGTGWEPLMRYGASTISHKILYGSGAFLIGRPHAVLADEARALPLPADILHKWLWRNSANVFNIDPSVALEHADGATIDS